MTRHQPISMPIGPSRGRECQCPQPGSPRSSRETRTHLKSCGAASIRSHQLAVLILDPSPLDEGASRLRDAVGEAIADPLELAEIEDAGRGGDRVDPVRHLGVTEGLGEEPAQLASSRAIWRRS